MPRVSIVIPVHNQPVLVLEAVASLQAQSLADWEAILVDDGSTDETPEVLQRLAAQDQRLTVLVGRQRGAAAARNTGAAKARSDWLLFLDSDDWLARDALASLSRLCKHADLVYGVGVRVCGDRMQKRSQVELPRGELFHRLASSNLFMVHSCLLRNSTFRDLGGFEETLMGCADWDLWQRVVRSGARCAGVDELVAYYRHAESSLSTHYEQELRDGLIVIDRGHGRDRRVPRPRPAYAEGAPRAEYSAAAYRFASWLGALAIARKHSPRGVLRGIAALPAETLSAPHIASAVFDAVPIGLGDFSPSWEACWPGLRPPLQSFVAELSMIAGCGPDFAGEVLHHVECLAAAANAGHVTGVVGSAAARVIQIPGPIPHLRLAPGTEAFVAVVRSGQVDLGPVVVPVDATFSDVRVREVLVASRLRAVTLSYLRRSPVSTLCGLLKHAVARTKHPISSPRTKGGYRASIKARLGEAMLAQPFILPVGEGREDGQS
jgi:glycosyltransferase involved in cell wall biosynthesis